MRFPVESVVFIRELSDVTVKKLGDKAILECEISKEGLTLDWFKAGKKLRKSDKYEIEVDGKVHRLILNDAELDDAAEYSAAYQMLTTMAKLTVAGKMNKDGCCFANNICKCIFVKESVSILVYIPHKLVQLKINQHRFSLWSEHAISH